MVLYKCNKKGSNNMKKEILRKVNIKINGVEISVEGWSPKQIAAEIKKQLETVNGLTYVDCIAISKEIYVRMVNNKSLFISNGLVNDRCNCQYLIHIVGEREKETVKKVLRGVEEFNGMTPSEALDTIKNYVVWAIDQGLEEDERVSDAIKRLQLLIEEAK